MTASAVYESRYIKRKRSTRSEMQELRERLADLVEQNQPATVRQIFYQAVSKGLVNKTEAQYQKIVRVLGEMRLSHRIPFYWIADHTRWQRKPRSFSSIEHALEWTAQTYRRALWDDMDVYVEVWLEKEALAGVIYEETKDWDVPLMVTRGYASLSYLYDAADAIKEIGKPTYLYYLGDHDPSGVDIPRQVERRLREFAPASQIHFERIAVTPGQIEYYGLQTRPTKKSDTRNKNFVGESVEVDAIDPHTLRGLVRYYIQRHVDRRALEVLQVAEASERDILSRLALENCG